MGATSYARTPCYNDSLRPNGSEYFNIGNNVATLAHKYRLQEGAPPALLVARMYDPRKSIGTAVDKWENPYYDMVEKLVKGDFSGSASLYRSTLDWRLPDNLASVSSDL